MLYTAWFCLQCEKELTSDQVYHSSGRCPLCGLKHKQASSIVYTYELGYEEVKVPSGKWYKRDQKVRKYSPNRHYSQVIYS